MRSLFPQAVDRAYKRRSGAVILWVHPRLCFNRTAHYGGHSEEQTADATVATVSPAEVTRNPEAVDFEKLLSDLSTAFIRVSVQELDDEIERRLLQVCWRCGSIAA